MKILILGRINDDNMFAYAEEKIRKEGNIPINPNRVYYALPEDINLSDFIAVMIELVRISDAVLLSPNWKNDLSSMIAMTNAQRNGKELIEWH